MSIKNSYTNWQSAENSLVERSIYCQWITMRDGVRLDSHIFFPKAGCSPYASILIRSPYALKTLLDGYAQDKLILCFLEQGYVLVLQQERGRYGSEGYSRYLGHADSDGYDTIEWLCHQPWSNGKVGTLGCSSMGSNQLCLAKTNHPAHCASIAGSPGTGIGKVGPYQEHGFFRGGALHLWSALWFKESIHYGRRGAGMRPQFPRQLQQSERVKLSTLYNLEPTESSKIQNYQDYFNHLPICDINQAAGGMLTDWDDLCRLTPNDPEWRKIPYLNEGDEVTLPILWLLSWYDICVAPALAFFVHLSRKNPYQFVLISPLTHCCFGQELKQTRVGQRLLGDARYDYENRLVQWFDYWLKGQKNSALEQASVQYYQMGENRWISTDQFPRPKTDPLELQLISGGNANTRHGDGGLKFPNVPIKQEASMQAPYDEFIFDPLNPVPTMGGGACCLGDISPGAFDQSGLEARSDVLVYTSHRLKEAITVAGFIEVELFMASDAKDTDITVKLVDVYPDGRAYNLDDSIFRVRYRNGYDQPVLMDSGRVYKIQFPPMVTANTFKVGHRVRLDISSSNFPRYDRNLNTGGNNYDEIIPQLATNRIYHSESYCSRLILPVTKPS